MAKRILWSNVSLSVSRGEFVALLGPNGVGKTILLKVILGLVPLAKGEVRVFGLPPREARARVGYLPQARTFDQSLRVRGVDIVRLGLDGDRWGMPFPGRSLFRTDGSDGHKRVGQVIDLVGASAYANRPIGNLSGGEQKRLLIAQAIVRQPDLLLLDEPLASLDYPNQTAITALVSRISRETAMTVIMVTHDVNRIIGQAGKLIYIAKQGVAAGTPSEVISSETLSRIYGARVEVHSTADGRLLVVPEPEGETGLTPSPGDLIRVCDEEEHEGCDGPG
jgi:zinc/manganese transport system ATP-binding protein